MEYKVGDTITFTDDSENKIVLHVDSISDNVVTVTFSKTSGGNIVDADSSKLSVEKFETTLEEWENYAAVGVGKIIIQHASDSSSSSNTTKKVISGILIGGVIIASIYFITKKD